MKKLLIASAAIALTLGVNAASVSWAISANPGSPVKTYDGSVYRQPLYLVDGSASSIAAITAKLAAGDMSFSSWDSTASTVPATGGTDPRTVTSDSMTTDPQKFAVLLIDTTYGTEGQYGYMFSVAKDATPSGDPKNPAQIGFSTALGDFSGGSWATYSGSEPVPEPTSGMLLLLGFAGLMLRRKRA